MRIRVFISHASEDKAEVVRPLAISLRSKGYDVWYDEFSLRVGDSLRRSVERGLKNAHFGVVVLSPNFFAKEWPQRELDAILGKENDGDKVLLPIWHNTTRDEVASFSPIVAERLAASTSDGLDQVVALIIEATAHIASSPETHPNSLHETQVCLSVHVAGASIVQTIVDAFCRLTGTDHNDIKSARVMIQENNFTIDGDSSYLEFLGGGRWHITDDNVLLSVGRDLVPEPPDKYSCLAWSIVDYGWSPSPERDLSKQTVEFLFGVTPESVEDDAELMGYLLSVSDFAPVEGLDLWWGDDAVGRRIIRKLSDRGRLIQLDPWLASELLNTGSYGYIRVELAEGLIRELDLKTLEAMPLLTSAILEKSAVNKYGKNILRKKLGLSEE